MRPPLPPSRFRRLAKWVVFGPILVSVALLIVSYSGAIVFAPQTKRHRIMFAGGGVMLHWQERSMPTDLPTEDSLEYQSWAEPLGPTDRKTALSIGSNRELDLSSTRWRAARYEPGMKSMRINFPQVAWLPKYQFNADADTHVVTVPTYLPACLIVAAAGVLWLRDHRTVKPGQCPNCGYDLRASKEKCPECGVAIRMSSSARAR